MDYEVVLRSHTRLRPREGHRHWLNRWEQFTTKGGHAHRMPMEKVLDLETVRDHLLSDNELVACVLSGPPDRDPGHTEMTAAMAAVPAVEQIQA